MYLALKSEVPCIGLGKSPSTSQPPKKRFFIDCFIQTKTNPLCRITWRWFRRICSIQIYCIPCLSTTALSSPPTVCINISISGTSEMDWQTYRHYDKLIQEPTSSKKPIRTRYLGQVTGYQPIRDQYFLIRSVPAQNTELWSHWKVQSLLCNNSSYCTFAGHPPFPL